ncbi:hypothetical protein [Bifidobacterium gallicum]|nr:hypothetical protein [Bifidobacterium gallicum]
MASVRPQPRLIVHKPPKRWSANLQRAMGEAQEAGRCLITSGEVRRTVRDRTATGEFTQIMPGIYYPTDAWNQLSVQGQTLMLLRSLQIQHPQWVFTGMHAAMLHNLYYSTLVLGKRGIHILTTRGTGPADRTHVKRHHVAAIEYEEIQGIKVATGARTVVDCANNYEFRDALGVADSYLRSGGYFADIYAAANDHCTPQLVDVLRYTDQASESGGESFSRGTMIEMGYVVPLLQVVICVQPENQMRRLDYVWILPDGTWQVFECDGMQKYVDPETNRIINNRVSDQLLRDKQILETGVRKVTHFTVPEAINKAPLRRKLADAGIPKASNFPRIAPLLNKHGN